MSIQEVSNVELRSDEFARGDIVELPPLSTPNTRYYIIAAVHDEYCYINLQNGMRRTSSKDSIREMIADLLPIARISSITLKERK